MRVNFKIAGLVISFIFLSDISFGQILISDSCGLDSNPVLNKYEIRFIDSILLHPYSTKKSGTIDRGKGFDFTSKKMAFYSCTINMNTRGHSLITKQQFCDLVKPTPMGMPEWG